MQPSKHLSAYLQEWKMRLRIHIIFLIRAPLHSYQPLFSISTLQNYSLAFHKLWRCLFHVCKVRIRVVSSRSKYTTKQWQQLLISNLPIDQLFNIQSLQPAQHSFLTLKCLSAKLELTITSWIPNQLLLLILILWRYCKWHLNLLTNMQVRPTLLSNFISN